MSKLKVSQRYIFKIHTARLRSAKWDLKLTLSDARKNDEMISIGENQMLRWIDELNGLRDTDERYSELKRRKNALRKQPVTKANRSEMKRIDDELDKLLFKPDYIHLVIDKDKDLKRACKGFRVNGIKYVRLLGTSGGVKTSTIVFVNERFASILRVRIDNGRNPDAMLVPAKFEAYRALTCSGTTPVSAPRGILVVEDSKTMFREDVLYLTDENDGEPELRLWKDFDVELDASDGCGMMLPSLAARWSEELGLGYLMSACNTRFSWEKGVLFTFDYVEFADKVAGTRMVRDAWGNEVDISTVEVVLTTSMLKLWKCYDSIDHYLRCCEENHYRFGIAKISPQELENKRATNYQFLQPLDLNDEQIDQLIQPTISEIRDVLSGDYRKTLLFLGGSRMTEETVLKMDPYIQALMVEPRLFRDGHIRRKVYKMIRKRIDDAKIGVIDVHANYSILGGDLYALCQSIFDLPVTGLLKAGELYNQYWLDAGAGEVACFRAPMSTKENIRKMQVANGEEVRYWFRYIKTCTLLNAFDTTMQALNGCDFDGDIMFITDNPVILRAVVPTKTLYCAQKSALKKVVTEADLVQSNIDGFGNEVGRVTNWVTSMYEVQARFSPESDEYKALAYRIQSGQQYQQNND